MCIPGEEKCKENAENTQSVIDTVEELHEEKYRKTLLIIFIIPNMKLSPAHRQLSPLRPHLETLLQHHFLKSSLTSDLVLCHTLEAACDEEVNDPSSNNLHNTKY